MRSCYLELARNIVLVQRKYSSELEALGHYVDWFVHLLGTDCHRTRSNLAHPPTMNPTACKTATHHAYASRRQIQFV